MLDTGANQARKHAVLDRLLPSEGRKKRPGAKFANFVRSSATWKEKKKEKKGGSRMGRPYYRLPTGSGEKRPLLVARIGKSWFWLA